MQKWAAEGHLPVAEADAWSDGNEVDAIISERLGFDLNWQSMFIASHRLHPGFQSRVVEEFEDGSKHVLSGNGVVVVQRRRPSLPRQPLSRLSRLSWGRLLRRGRRRGCGRAWHAAGGADARVRLRARQLRRVGRPGPSIQSRDAAAAAQLLHAVAP